MRINSGFRAGSVDSKGRKITSQHNKGMAADLSWPAHPGDPNTFATEIFNWMMSTNLPFDQVISERKGSMWIHVSYNAMSPTQRTKVNNTPNGESPYPSGWKVFPNANTWGGVQGPMFP